MSEDQEMIVLGMQQLKSVQKSLKQLTRLSSKQKYYWNILLERIDKFPTECKILETRQAIEELWVKCLKSDDDLKMIKETRSDNFSDEVLKNHEAELAELQEFYADNKELIEMITKYDALWGCMDNVDKQASNPERLFKNRGAQLLKEEHDRKLSGKLPKQEKEILSLLEKRRHEGQEEFLVRGELFKDLAKRRWQEHKENNRACKRPRVQMLKSNSVGPDAKRRHLEESNKVHSRRSSDTPGSASKVPQSVNMHGTASKVPRSLNMH